MLPFLVAITFVAVIMTFKHKTLSMRLLAIVATVAAVYFLADGLIAFPYTTPDIIVWCYIICSFSVPALPLAFTFFCWSLYTQQQRYDRKLFFFCAIPGVLGILELAVYAMLGFDNAADYISHGRSIPADVSELERGLYEIFEGVSNSVYILAVEVSMIISIIPLIWILYKTDFKPSVVGRFLFNSGPIRVLHLEILAFFCLIVFCAVRLVLSRREIVEDPTMALIVFMGMGLSAGVIGFLGVHLRKPCVYLHKTHYRPKFDDMPVDFVFHKRRLNDDEDDEADSYRTLNLRHEFKEIMREQQSYLQPGMNRYSVSGTLDISREALDRLVRIVYHITYEEYIMIQRVEHQTRYRTLYPHEPLETVAMECGFQSAASMNEQIKICRGIFDIKA